MAQNIGYMSGCRSFISLDGLYLKRGYVGVMLTTIFINENNGIYPMVLGICKEENNHN